MQHPFNLDFSELENIGLEIEELSNNIAEKVSGGADVTTLAIGEEGGGVTTLALGEEGGKEPCKFGKFDIDFTFPSFPSFPSMKDDKKK
jgi:hypothetical protein